MAFSSNEYPSVNLQRVTLSEMQSDYDARLKELHIGKAACARANAVSQLIVDEGSPTLLADHEAHPEPWAIDSALHIKPFRRYDSIGNDEVVEVIGLELSKTEDGDVEQFDPEYVRSSRQTALEIVDVAFVHLDVLTPFGDFTRRDAEDVQAMTAELEDMRAYNVLPDISDSLSTIVDPKVKETLQKYDDQSPE